MRRGLSLIETLVVLALIAILVGLLLPAIQHVRRSAARGQTLSQLAQIGLAVHDYESAHARRLPGTGLARYDDFPSLFYELLPYLEQEAVYREFPRQGFRILLPAEGGPTRVVPALVGPPDASLPGRISNFGWACASYVANPGFFQEGGGFEAVTDGLSTTLMASERVMRCGNTDNAWLLFQPEGLIFGAAPPHGNLGGGGPCNPERVASAHPGLICVVLGDGSARAFPHDRAAEIWVKASDPADGSGSLD